VPNYGRNRRHFPDHRKHVFLKLPLIPKDDAERVGRDIGDFNQSAVERGKTLADTVIDCFFSRNIFLVQYRTDVLNSDAYRHNIISLHLHTMMYRCTTLKTSAT